MSDYRIVVDPKYGYLRLDPVPSDTSKLYEDDYYDLIRLDGRSSELHHLMQGGEEAEQELRWLQSTLYADIADMLCDHAPNKRVLDIGCGTGEFAEYLAIRGFDAIGIDPSSYAIGQATARGVAASRCTLEEYVRKQGAGTFGSVAMLNVLKHVPDAPGFLDLAKGQLAPGGMLCIRVPNDFSKLKVAVQTSLKKPEWWVSVPDHINYFNVESLTRLLGSLGWEITKIQTDFPMELFLLMGHDYVDHPEVGGYCHERRVFLEMNIPTEVRRSLYEALAKAGIGGNCLVFCKVRER